MFKFILLSAFVIFASANFAYVGNATTPTGELLQGVCDTLSIANDTDVDQCGDVPLVQDIEKLVTDLNQTIPNPLALIEDATAIFKDYQAMNASCPEVASAFGTYFANFTTAFDNAKLKTVEHVLDNIKNNFAVFGEDVADFIEDIHGNDYYSAGQAFGGIIQIAMIGYTA